MLKQDLDLEHSLLRSLLVYSGMFSVVLISTRDSGTHAQAHLCNNSTSPDSASSPSRRRVENIPH